MEPTVQKNSRKMPKHTAKKLKNKNLDKKRPYKKRLFPITAEDRDLFDKADGIGKLNVLYELMKHFEIDKSKEEAWIELSWRLAELYVPAMHREHRKGPHKKWNFITLWALAALVERTKQKYPDDTRKQIFNRLPKEAQGTSLENIIKPNTSPRTLEAQYDRFVPSFENYVMGEWLKNSRKNRQDLNEYSLKIEHKEFYNESKYFPDILEAFLLKFSESIFEK